MQFHFPISPRPVISDYDHHLPLVVMQLEPTAPTSSGNTNKCTCWWIYCYANQCKRLNLQSTRGNKCRPFELRHRRVFFSCWCRFCYIWKCIYSMSSYIYTSLHAAVVSSALNWNRKAVRKGRYHHQSTCVYWPESDWSVYAFLDFYKLANCLGVN